jgi:hypothetical protein
MRNPTRTLRDMPNPDNIQCPITLFGYGRSGTSLVFDAFMRHPDVFAAGETAPLIHGVWDALEQGLGNCAERVKDGRPLTIDERCVESVRAILLNEFPSTERLWMQKPIGIASSAYYRLDGPDGFEGFADWYWKAFSLAFPGATCFTIIRDPFDVALSAFKYSRTYAQTSSLWGKSLTDLINEIILLQRVIARCPSELTIIEFDTLVGDPKTTLARLFQICCMPFSQASLEAFHYKHAAYVGSYGTRVRETRANAAEFSYKEEYERLFEHVEQKLLKELQETTEAIRRGGKQL